MEDQVPFKVFTHWKEGEKPEIRRFGIEKSVVTSYHYLNAKIQDIFPRLKGKAYSVTWKDEDGDDVVISSDDEVMTALQALSGDVIKLFIYCNGDDTKDDDVDIVITASTENHPGAASGNAMHYGVMCDSCDAPVVGFRYKCTTCDDFDLCSRCEAAGHHPEHCMVRVPTPVMPRTVIKAAIKRSRHFLKTVAGAVGEDCPYKKHRRDRSGGRHRGEAHGHHHGEEQPRDRYHCRRPRSSWLDTFATYMNEFADLAGIDIDTVTNKPETKPQETTQPPQGQAKQQEKASNGQEKPTNEAPQPEARASNAETQRPRHVVNFNQLLEGFLNGQAAAFIPQPPQGAAASTTKDTEMGQGDRKASEDKVTVKTETDEQGRDSTPDKADDWTMINKEKDLMDTSASAPQEPVAPIGFNLPEEFQERVKISEGSIYPPLHAATAEAEGANAAQQPAPAYAQATGAAAAAPPTAAAPKPATAPPQPPKQLHPKPHIDAAIQHMLAMGFTNDGGWLTQLLESKDGNIAAVLDLLTPVNPKK